MSGAAPSTSASSLPPGLAAERRALLQRRVRLVVAATIGYNAVEAVVALTAGSLASSTALVSFGLDSCVEVLSAAAIAWQFSAADPRSRERAALRTVAFAFFALAAYVTVSSVHALLGPAEAGPSTVGLVLAATSVVVMPVLSWVERRTGRELGSASVVADSKQTLLCSYLSAVLLVGLLLNSTLGWSWADPVAALLIAVVAVREGVSAWRGDACCSHPDALLADSAGGSGCCDASGCRCAVATGGAHGPQTLTLVVPPRQDGPGRP
jgi:divalent metal cation (Fe/Co/Zn/Cd) transporter